MECACLRRCVEVVGEGSGEAARMCERGASGAVATPARALPVLLLRQMPRLKSRLRSAAPPGRGRAAAQCCIRQGRRALNGFRGKTPPPPRGSRRRSFSSSVCHH